MSQVWDALHIWYGNPHMRRTNTRYISPEDARSEKVVDEFFAWKASLGKARPVETDMDTPNEERRDKVKLVPCNCPKCQHAKFFIQVDTGTRELYAICNNCGTTTALKGIQFLGGQSIKPQARKPGRPPKAKAEETKVVPQITRMNGKHRVHRAKVGRPWEALGVSRSSYYKKLRDKTA
jgi:hypothetical protein